MGKTLKQATAIPNPDFRKRPVINTPFEHPGCHWELDPKTFRAINKINLGRRLSGAYLSVPTSLETAGSLRTREGDHPHSLINDIRTHVAKWRKAHWKGANKVTVELLEYWTGNEVEKRPFFCQIEAVETLIWLHEAGSRFDRKSWKGIVDQLKQVNAEANEDIERFAIKMATGTGKTILMKMVISWIALNPKGKDVDFLVIVPGLTVKDRLKELHPNEDIEGETRKNFDALLPKGLKRKMYRVKVNVINFQAFKRRDTLYISGEDDKLSGPGRGILAGSGQFDKEQWKETDQEMLARLLGPQSHKRIVVLNDEAHHCYKPFVQRAAAERSDAEDREYEENAALWFNALRTLSRQGRLVRTFDFSATPMYLRKPDPEKSELFPWTVTDYPLIEAIEAGLTKIPKVPVKDDTDKVQPVYRNVYKHTKQKTIVLHEEPETVTTLLEQMYEDYHDHYELEPPNGNKPVMIVVANSVKSATALYGHIAGYKDGKIWKKGNYELFSNVRQDGSDHEINPRTLLVHSSLDSIEDMTPTLQKVLDEASTIHAPKAKTRKDRLEKVRRIFNTVGQEGKDGQHIRCVVSVSMLTEGWDAKTVTHIFGFRKFGTQLLCEQVVGRGLRKTSLEGADEKGHLPAEVVHVFGVPFDFMLAADEEKHQRLLIDPYRVYSIPKRAKTRRVHFPNVTSYRIEDPNTQLVLDRGKVNSFEVRTGKIPSMTEIMGTLGDSHVSVLTEKRRRHILYKLAAEVLKVIDLSGETRRRELFASALKVVEEWLGMRQVRCSDLRLLLYDPRVPREIARCVKAKESGSRIVPVFANADDPSEPLCLDTGGVDYWTTVQPYYDTKGDTKKSEINRAPCDSGSEIKVAQALDSIRGITAWARNFRLGWTVPYYDWDKEMWRQYVPDFVARANRKSMGNKTLHLVIEYKGIVDEDSEIKKKAMVDWWLPAVNGSDVDCCKGEWRYVFIDNERKIRPMIEAELKR